MKLQITTGTLQKIHEICYQVLLDPKQTGYDFWRDALTKTAEKLSDTDPENPSIQGYEIASKLLDHFPWEEI